MENAFGDSVEIASMRPNVEILRSKTRPKKLVFMGTDGKQYQYILKAREDLHLDQRIMQVCFSDRMTRAMDELTEGLFPFNPYLRFSLS